MGEFPRKADGRRVFTPEFERGVVKQILKGEKTLAELSRELDISPPCCVAGSDTTRQARARRGSGTPFMTSEELLAELGSSPTDLARAGEAVSSSELLYVLVPLAALKGWPERDPDAWRTHRGRHRASALDPVTIAPRGRWHLRS